MSDTKSSIVWRVVPSILMSVVMAAHFFRWNQPGLVFVVLLAPLLLVFKSAWQLTVYRFLLVIGACVWIQYTFDLINDRSASAERLQ